MKYTKDRPLTEIEQIKQSVPNFDAIPLKMISNAKGEILKLETDNIELQTVMRSYGFDENEIKAEIVTISLVTKIKNLFNL